MQYPPDATATRQILDVTTSRSLDATRPLPDHIVPTLAETAGQDTTFETAAHPDNTGTWKHAIRHTTTATVIVSELTTSTLSRKCLHVIAGGEHWFWLEGNKTLDPDDETLGSLADRHLH